MNNKTLQPTHEQHFSGWNEDVAEDVFAIEASVERSTTAIISLGERYAFNLPSDTQIVIGAALPIGLTSQPCAVWI